MNADPRYELVEQDGPGFLRCSLLEDTGLVHGFATRRGGVSTGSFASLNFGLKAGDDPLHVGRNLELFGERVGFLPDQFFRTRQVHGRQIRVVEQTDVPAELVLQEADALVTSVPGQAVGVLTADCVPILLADMGRGVVAAVHAGWRGLAAGVIPATVEVLCQRFGCASSALRAAAGPCIGPCCYEVGPEVAAQFTAWPGAVREEAGRRPHLDLAGATRAMLLAAGLALENIGTCPRCTCCESDLLFSFRRDGARSGHQLSVIGLTTR